MSSTDLDMDNLLSTFEEELVARERASGSKTTHTPPHRTQAKHQSSALLKVTLGVVFASNHTVQLTVLLYAMSLPGSRF